MNALVNFAPGAVSSRFANVPRDNDMSAGIAAGFGIIGYKGKAWSTKYRGTDTTLMRADGDGPMNSIDVVIVKASGHVSKIFYVNGYVEGSTAPPDCYSTNGVTPAAGSTIKQCTACAICPQNQWGSRITPAGKQGKSCSDSKRLAIVPFPDVKNEGLGGPMLLRVPAASLRDLGAFDDKMKGMGYPYYSLAAKISFDPAEAYPKFVFTPLAPLTDEQADVILAYRDSNQVSTILAEGSEVAVAPAAAEALPAAFAGLFAPLAKAAPAPAPVVVATAPALAAASGGFGGAPVATAQVTPRVTAAPVAQVVAAPVAAPATQVGSSAFEDALDAQLNALLPA
jgi:hypothetical protein